jgi:hypothetical protein
VNLRPYQELLINQARTAYASGFKAPLLVAPTGSGKTVMFSAIAQGAASRGHGCIILAHRQELLTQISNTLTMFDVPHGTIAATHKATPESAAQLVQVASVQTIVRRLDRVTPPKLIIIDEAHHAIKRTAWGRVVDHFRDAKILGVTATPERLSGEGLDDLFDYMILGPSVRELQELGALCPVRTFAPPGPDLSGVRSSMGDWVQSELADAVQRSSVMGDAIQHYRKHCDGQPAIAFCVSVKHAQHVAQQFRDAGYRAESIDGAMKPTDRHRIIKEFTDGIINVITSCDLISEGFDVPRAAAAILLRPTQSRALFLQQCGRALRPWSGKDCAVILDHAGNTRRFGLCTQQQEWNLAGKPRRAGKSRNDPAPAGLRICLHCFAADDRGSLVCRECGSPFPVKQRVQRVIDGSLVEVDGDVKPVRGKPLRQEQSMTSTLEGLIELGKIRGYANPRGWATHIMAARGKRVWRKA